MSHDVQLERSLKRYLSFHNLLVVVGVFIKEFGDDHGELVDVLPGPGLRVEDLVDGKVFLVQVLSQLVLLLRVEQLQSGVEDGFHLLRRKLSEVVEGPHEFESHGEDLVAVGQLCLFLGGEEHLEVGLLHEENGVEYFGDDEVVADEVVERRQVLEIVVQLRIGLKGFHDGIKLVLGV